MCVYDYAEIDLVDHAHDDFQNKNKNIANF
jgi:hypothetical protein